MHCSLLHGQHAVYLCFQNSGPDAYARILSIATLLLAVIALFTLLIQRSQLDDTRKQAEAAESQLTVSRGQFAQSQAALDAMTQMLTEREAQLRYDRRVDGVRATLDLVSQIELYLSQLKSGQAWPEPPEPATDDQFGSVRNRLLTSELADLVQPLDHLQQSVADFKERAQQRAISATKVNQPWWHSLPGDVDPNASPPTPERVREEEEQQKARATLKVVEEQADTFKSRVTAECQRLRDKALGVLSEITQAEPAGERTPNGT